MPEPTSGPEMVRKLIEDAGGTIDEMMGLPDGSGFATASFPLPTDHWSVLPGDNVPPMPFRMGTAQEALFAVKGGPMPEVLTRQEVADRLRAAAKYAIRSATMNGQSPDFDPDAMVQNFVVGMLGYWTDSGLSGDEWANPPRGPWPGTREDQKEQ